jgi:hypothetical protein
MYLAVPREVVKSYGRKTQQFISYYGPAPGCEAINLMDPIYQLYPEELANAQPGDFNSRRNRGPVNVSLRSLRPLLSSRKGDNDSGKIDPPGSCIA